MNDLKSTATDFAGTDGPDLTKVPSGQTAVVAPISVAPVAFIYKLKTSKGKNIKGIRLTPAVLSMIYSGQTKYWDDKNIKMINKSVAKTLPHIAIVPMVRAAGSGTTKNFTAYLAALVPNGGWTATKDFALTANASKPANLTQQPNSDAMVNGIASTNGSIGYADLPDTLVSKRILTASLQNNKGQFVVPTSASGTKFVNGVGTAFFANGFVGGTNATTMFKLRISGAYQLTAITYLQASATTSDKNAAVRDYVQYAISSCQGKAGFSRLSGAALVIAQQQAAKIGVS
jgi:phosphate transport system substrate-binding protein